MTNYVSDFLNLCLSLCYELGLFAPNALNMSPVPLKSLPNFVIPEMARYTCNPKFIPVLQSANEPSPVRALVFFLSVRIDRMCSEFLSPAPSPSLYLQAKPRSLRCKTDTNTRDFCAALLPGCRKKLFSCFSAPELQTSSRMTSLLTDTYIPALRGSEATFFT